MTERETTRVDRTLAVLKNHPIAAWVIVLAIVAIGIGQLSGALSTTLQFIRTLVGDGREGLRAEYCDLLRPLIVEFDRHKSAFDRWDVRHLRPDHATTRDAILAAREILRGKARLVPMELSEDSRRLVEYFDRWLEEYEIRGSPTADTTPVPLVPEGYLYPSDAEQHFRKRAHELDAHLGSSPCK